MGSQIGCEVPYLICGTNVVAYILTVNGTAEWLADRTLGSIQSSSIFLILIIAAALGVYGHVVVPCATALLSILTPIVLMLAPQFNISPMMMGLVVGLAAHVTTLLPHADAVSLATYDHNYWTMAEMIKPSLIYGTLWIPISVLYLYFFQVIGIIA